MIARANALGAAANLGALGGSGIAGGVSSLASQVGSEMGFSTQMSGLSRDISDAQMRAMRWQAIGQNWSALGNLGASVFNAAGGFDAFRGGGNTPTSPAQAVPQTRPTARPQALPINSANPYGYQ